MRQLIRTFYGISSFYGVSSTPNYYEEMICSLMALTNESEENIAKLIDLAEKYSYKTSFATMAYVLNAIKEDFKRGKTYNQTIIDLKILVGEETEKVMNEFNNLIGGKENMVSNYNTKSLVDLWARKNRDAITNEMKNKQEELVTSDENYSLLNEHVEKINEIINDKKMYNLFNRKGKIETARLIGLLELNAYDICTQETKEKIANIETTYKIQDGEVLKIKEELDVLLSACESARDEYGILQKRGIVDENYKILQYID